MFDIVPELYDTLLEEQKLSRISESESEYLFGHLDPVTPAKTVADRCRRGHHQNIQYTSIT